MKNSLFHLLFFLNCSAFAQSDKLELTGTIHEMSGTPIPYVTIFVYSEKDSALVNGTSSDTLGKFSVDLENGNYYVKFRFLSYQEKFISGVIAKGI